MTAPIVSDAHSDVTYATHTSAVAVADDLDELADMADGDDDSVPAFGRTTALFSILGGGALTARRRL